MSTALIPVPFRGGVIEAIEQGGEYWVVVKRICGNLGIAEQRQQAKLKSKPWSRTTMMVAHDASGREQEMFCLHLRSLPAWLFSISATKVREDLRPELIAYQQDAADTLYRRFLAPQEPAPPLPGSQPAQFITADNIAQIAQVVAVAVAASLSPVLERLVPRAMPAPQPALPAPLPTPKPLTSRARLNRHMREALAMSAPGESYGETIKARWHRLCNALYDREGIDIDRRAEHLGLSRLDAAERIKVPGRGLVIDLMLALALDIYPMEEG